MLKYNPTSVRGSLVGLNETSQVVSTAMPYLVNATIGSDEGKTWYDKAWGWIKSLAPYVKKGI